MALVRRWLVQKYKRGKWITLRSFATRSAAQDWFEKHGTPDMRIREIAI